MYLFYQVTTLNKYIEQNTSKLLFVHNLNTLL